jgi:hypothetical protein
MRHIVIRTAVAAVALAAFVGVAAIPAGATAGSANHRVLVPLGHSIQKAINEAPPGTTIVLEPGIYQQSVMIRKDEITLQGAGPGEDGTILMPPAKLPANLCRKIAKWTGVCVLATHFDHGQITKTADNDVVTGITFDGGWNFGVFGYGTTGLQILNNEAAVQLLRRGHRRQRGVRPAAGRGGRRVRGRLAPRGRADSGERLLGQHVRRLCPAQSRRGGLV